MTKFMQKSFSVFNNYIKAPTCDDCGCEAVTFNITIEGKVCNQCYQKNKLKRLEAKLNQLKKS